MLGVINFKTFNGKCKEMDIKHLTQMIMDITFKARVLCLACEAIHTKVL